MKKRSVVGVFLLTLITFGIYGIVWNVKTKGEMVKLGADIPTSWLIIVPIANIYWLWKYCVGVEKVTNGKTSGALAFILLWLLGVIGMMVIQSEFNNLAAGGTANEAVAAPAPAPVNVPESTPNTPTPES
ncbi:MAG: DUF4234 domain-containing protein [Patescibacteria group bacterium]